MLDKLQEIELTFIQVEKDLSNPEIISNIKEYQKTIEKHNELKEIVQAYKKLKNIQSEIINTQELLEDPECAALAKDELHDLNLQEKKILNSIKELLSPKDPNDKKNAIVEVRQGTGGDEAALFAEDLFRMYKRFSEKKSWSLEVLSETLSDLGGIKEVSFLIKGKNVFQNLKFESGTHRVQRVPKTESSGRIHTSAATVAILPEAEEVDIEINPKDLRIDTFRASGAGGQHVNKTSSAIRITHLPTNVVVACQDERSQFQNKDKAMQILRAKLYEQELQKQNQEHSENRKQQVGSGDRSEKVRTYNFPQGRVTDHRIGCTIHYLSKFLDGELDEMIQNLHQKMNLDELTQ